MQQESIQSQTQLLTEHLMATHGPVIGYVEFAQILGTTPTAMRLRECRRGDLPPSIPGLAARRWPVPVIAAWLLRQSSSSPDHASNATPRRGPGRPRKQPPVRLEG